MTAARRLPSPLVALWVSLFAVASALAAPPTGETLRVAVHLGALRDASRTDVEVSLKVWAEEIMRVLEVPAEIRFYQALPEMRSDLAVGRVNFLIADGISLLRNFDPDALADGFGSRGRNEDGLVLLARKDAGIRGARDLVGRRIILMADHELSDIWLEATCLRTFRKPCARASLAVSRESRSQQQVLKLFFGKADAALVRRYAYDLATELNPQIGDQLQVVEQIAIYPSALGLFSNSVSQKFRDYVIAKVPLMQNHPRGRQIMEVLQSDQVDRFPKTVLEPIRDLLREHESLAARYAVGGRTP